MFTECHEIQARVGLHWNIIKLNTAQKNFLPFSEAIKSKRLRDAVLKMES